MLDIIVLGYIPGTHLQITFAWILFALVASVIWLDIKLRGTKQSDKKSKKPTARAKA